MAMGRSKEAVYAPTAAFIASPVSGEEVLALRSLTATLIGCRASGHGVAHLAW